MQYGCIAYLINEKYCWFLYFLFGSVFFLIHIHFSGSAQKMVSFGRTTARWKFSGTCQNTSNAAAVNFSPKMELFWNFLAK